jgi:hypothetical protein
VTNTKALYKVITSQESLAIVLGRYLTSKGKDKEHTKCYASFDNRRALYMTQRPLTGRSHLQDALQVFARIPSNFGGPGDSNKIFNAPSYDKEFMDRQVFIFIFRFTSSVVLAIQKQCRLVFMCFSLAKIHPVDTVTSKFIFRNIKQEASQPLPQSPRANSQRPNMADIPPIPSSSPDADAPTSSVSEQARLRKERREAKIRAGGSARLNKITGLGGGVQRGLFYLCKLPKL